jgi:hypothetical protein
MLPSANESRAVVAWMKVLDRIEHTLGEALAFELEAAIPMLPPVAEAGSPLRPLEERLARLQACLDRAEENAVAIDACLQGEAEWMRHYLDQLRAGQRKLADWASRAV